MTVGALTAPGQRELWGSVGGTVMMIVMHGIVLWTKKRQTTSRLHPGMHDKWGMPLYAARRQVRACIAHWNM